MTQNPSSERYQMRGVSADKEDVHAAIENIDKGLFPKAFCKIVPDYLTGDANYCLVMHACFCSSFPNDMTKHQILLQDNLKTLLMVPGDVLP